MSDQSWDWAVGVLRRAVVDCEELLTDRDLMNIWELIEVGEPGLALETLSTQLYEYEVQVPAETQSRLNELHAYFFGTG